MTGPDDDSGTPAKWVPKVGERVVRYHVVDVVDPSGLLVGFPKDTSTHIMRSEPGCNSQPGCLTIEIRPDPVPLLRMAVKSMRVALALPGHNPGTLKDVVEKVRAAYPEVLEEGEV